jgi:hypothetical protein
MNIVKYLFTFIIINSSCLGMFVIPGQPEDAPLKIQKTGAQLEVARKHTAHMGSALDNPWVNDVLSKYDAIPQKSSAEISASSNSLIPDLYFANTSSVIKELILDKLNIKKRLAGLSHFQSIKRVPGTNYVYLDADDAKRSIAHLFIVQLASEPQAGTWQDTSAKENLQNKVVKKIELHKGADHYHPGGMDICGKYLVIPLEGNAGSLAAFYDISDPLNPIRLATHVTKNAGCMACALTRLPDDHYLFGIYTNSDKLALHYSKTTHLEDGFFDTPTITNLQREVSRDNYQNINFLTQSDGTLFMVASQNTEETSPIISGDDYMDLFIIEYDINKFAEINKQIAENKPAPTENLSAYARCLRQKNMKCGSQCNFNAGATLFIQDPDHIAIYATPHWPKDGKVRFNVYEKK